MMARIAVVYGSVRTDRQGIKAATFLAKELRGRGRDVTLVDPIDYQLPLLDKMYKEYENPPVHMKQLAETFDAADGFVIVTGEYNHGVPPALKNLLDHFQEEYLFKPSAIASYSAGSYGGVRAAVQMRIIASELGMPTISSMFAIPQVQNNFDEKGKLLTDGFDRRVNRFLDEFDWYVEALKEQGYSESEAWAICQSQNEDSRNRTDKASSESD